MKLRTLFSALAVAALLPVFAQTRLMPSDRLAMAGSRTSNGLFKAKSSGSVCLLMRYDDAHTLERLRERGAVVTIYPGNIAVVTTTVDQASALAALPGIRTASFAHKMHLHNNGGRLVGDVEKVWAGSGLPAAYTGKNVVVGIYDTGLDPNNPNFNDSTGLSRVKAVYRYPEGNATPMIYESQEEFRNMRTDDASQSHGTHVLGTMAGSFLSTSEDAADYRGMAPEADIIICTGQGLDSQMLDAIRRVGDYARSVGKPAVMNFSWGDNIGPHDGSDEFTAALNRLADEYDMLICVSAGNERSDRIAFVKDLTAEKKTLNVTLSRGYTSIIDANQGYGVLQVWASDSRPFKVWLEVIASTGSAQPEVLYSYEMQENTEAFLSEGSRLENMLESTNLPVMISDSTAFQEYFSQSFIGGLVGLDSINHKYCADLYSYLHMQGAETSGCRIRVRVEGSEGQRIFVYASNADYQLLGGEAFTGEGTNSNMACGPNTLSVGSYVSNSLSSFGYPSYKRGSISYFSSYGPTTDGERYVPDLCAPGQMIISSKNRYCNSYSDFATYKDPVTGSDVDYCVMQGTSMAAPNASGIGALIRDINPDLTYDQVKRILIEGCKAPTGDDAGWGAGRINAISAAKAAAAVSGIRGNAADTRAIITSRTADGSWDFTSSQSNGITVEIYAADGRLADKVHTPGTSITYSPSNLPGGIYMLRVSAGSYSTSFKIIR